MSEQANELAAAIDRAANAPLGLTRSLAKLGLRPFGDFYVCFRVGGEPGEPGEWLTAEEMASLLAQAAVDVLAMRRRADDACREYAGG